MKHHWKFPSAGAVCLLCTVFITIPAYAYVDPNAAGLVSQILTPLLIAAGVGATFFRKQVGELLAGLLRRLRPRADV
jgi:hypothetical protein